MILIIQVKSIVVEVVAPAIAMPRCSDTCQVARRRLRRVKCKSIESSFAPPRTSRFCVILVTLVLQGLTLPLLIRWLKVVDDVSIEREEMEGRLRTAQVAMARLEEITAQDSVLAEEMVEWLRTQYETASAT